MVYYHGNAGHIGDRMAKLSHFAAAGFGVLAVSYRGYGKSEGAPSEPGLYADARASLRHALDKLNVPARNILVYGESLGTGIATQMAKDMADAGHPVAGLVLEAPYTSVARRAQEMYPFLPAAWLARDKYHSIDKIDPDVPWQLSVELAEKLTREDVAITLVKDGDHRMSSPHTLALIRDAALGMAQKLQTA